MLSRYRCLEVAAERIGAGYADLHRARRRVEGSGRPLDIVAKLIEIGGFHAVFERVGFGSSGAGLGQLQREGRLQEHQQEEASTRSPSRSHGQNLPRMAAKMVRPNTLRPGDAPNSGWRSSRRFVAVSDRSAYCEKLQPSLASSDT